MGLEQYLYGRVARHCFPDDEETEDGFPVKVKELELGYWRKHYALNDYIMNNFEMDGNDTIHLDADDIREILNAITNRELPDQEAEYACTPKEMEARRLDDIETFTKALEWLNKTPAKPTMLETKTIKYETA